MRWFSSVDEGRATGGIEGKGYFKEKGFFLLTRDKKKQQQQSNESIMSRFQF